MKFLGKEREKTGSKDFSDLFLAVKNEFDEMLRVNINLEPFLGEERMRRIRRREEIREALRNCGGGDEKSKIFVKDTIKKILIQKCKVREENIDGFMEENAEYQFKRMLKEMREENGKEALERLIDTYFSHLLDKSENREITSEDVERVYEENFAASEGFPQKMEYVTQKIYEHYKGNGVIDEILELTIDGISGGVSGKGNVFPVWIMYRGNTIKLSFLAFDGEAEMKRICKNLCRGYGIGQLSERKGYVVAELQDGSRAAIARPPFCENWSFFIRKFKLENRLQITDMITGEASLEVIDLLRFLILGERLLCISGEQGSGKTSLLAALIPFIPEHLNIRVSEMSHELHLRERFPSRNIVSFKETENIGIQEGLDYLKKTDGNVTIIGEVASMQAVIYLVQVAQNASSFTLFTHHAKDSHSLIHYFRNALLMEGNFSNDRVALEQAVRSIHFNIKLAKDMKGERYIEKITEIIPSDGEEGFVENEILVRKNQGFLKKNSISREAKEEIYKRLTSEKQVEFLEFIKRW